MILYRIGLTGGIASGKSTVSGILREHGLLVIDADQVAREVVAPGEPAHRERAAHFGKEILLPDGQIDRQRLGQIIFADPPARQKLNEITHPRVRRRMDRLAEKAEQAGYRLPIVLDIPLLIESNMQHTVDEIWLIAVPPEVQVERLMARNQLSRSEALARVASQLPLTSKLPWASEVIDNGGSLAQTREQVARSLAQAMARARYSNQ